MARRFADPDDDPQLSRPCLLRPDSRPIAERLREAIGARFTVELGRWHDEPVGPHPTSMYQVAFAAAEFPRFVPWLMLNRGGLDVLVHPQTGDAYDDHTDHALWLGATAAAAARCIAPRPAGLSRAAARMRPSQQQHDQDDDEEADAAARVIAPSAAVRPCRQQRRSDEDQDDQKEKCPSRNPGNCP